jgi:predicted Zn-dependent protease
LLKLLIFNYFHRNILDTIAYNEALINNLIKKNQSEEAIPYIKSLLDMNPDNHDYHDLLMKATNPEDKAVFFDNLLKDYPQSTSIKLRRL